MLNRSGGRRAAGISFVLVAVGGSNLIVPYRRTPEPGVPAPVELQSALWAGCAMVVTLGTAATVCSLAGLDRSFTSRTVAGPRTAAIVAGTVELAHRLGMRLITEGVEDEETVATMIRLGCGETRGFRHSRPLPPAVFLEWVAARAGSPAPGPVPAPGPGGRTRARLISRPGRTPRSRPRSGRPRRS